MREGRTARPGVAVRRVASHQHGTPVRGCWIGVIAVLAVRVDVAVAEDPHRPSRNLEPRRLERLRQTLGGASPRLRGGERALRARDAGARPRHRSERHENHSATRKHVHDDSSRARTALLCATASHEWSTPPRRRTHETVSVRRRCRSRGPQPLVRVDRCITHGTGVTMGDVRLSIQKSRAAGPSPSPPRGVRLSSLDARRNARVRSHVRSASRRKNVSRLERPR